jgi:hypothetical protein
MLPQDLPAEFNRRVLEFLEPAGPAESRES